jgi:hypothetical protein
MTRAKSQAALKRLLSWYGFFANFDYNYIIYILKLYIEVFSGGTNVSFP